MAPLPSNNTGVLFLDYSVGGESHTLQARWASGSSVVDLMGVVDQFLAAMPTALTEITVSGARQRPAASTVTLPITWIGDPTYGTGGATHAQSAWYLDYIGRSTGGRRVRMSVFGAAVFQDNDEFDYRIPLDGEFLAAQQVLVSNTDILVAIDDLAPVWYEYVNTGVNAYWRNRIR